MHALFWGAISLSAQVGEGWIQYHPQVKIHLDNSAGLQIFSWEPSKSVGCADYAFDASTNTETFRLIDSRSNRSEIRLFNEYSTGMRQFEGYVTFFSPLNDESLMQIFGSSSGATQLMIRGYSSSGGEIKANGQSLITGCYGKEVRINVIHLQENAGNKIQLFVNGIHKHQITDNERVTNYHKYGCYGTLRTGSARVQWRDVRHFADASTAIAVEKDGVLNNRLVLVRENGREIVVRFLRAGGYSVILRSLAGKNLFSHAVEDGAQCVIPLHGEATGVYLLTVTHPGLRVTQKIVR
jgi:hypothetical protein